MLIQTNAYTLVIVLDSIHVQSFHYLSVAWENMSLFLEADISSSVHIDNKGKDILILSEGPAQVLNDTTLSAEAKYSFNFT